MQDQPASKHALARILPQTQGKLFLTDGGLETTLVFIDGIDLPCFAAIDMLTSQQGKERLIRYFETYLDIAHKAGAGFILESVTWRASRDWAEPLGQTVASLGNRNREAIEMLHELRARHETDETPIVISGCVGPRGDGYNPGALMTPEEARDYHGWQIGIFRESGADMVAAITMNNIPEAIGIAEAAKAESLPVAISFTVETDGRLPSGETLGEAIQAVDAATGGYPAYFMINCAHPSHFEQTLAQGGDWVGRIGGLRANASRCSHAELDEAEELDSGNPDELGREYRELLARFPNITVVGGCCGTDDRHVAAIAREVCPAPAG